MEVLCAGFPSGCWELGAQRCHRRAGMRPFGWMEMKLCFSLRFPKVEKKDVAVFQVCFHRIFWFSHFPPIFILLSSDLPPNLPPRASI